MMRFGVSLPWHVCTLKLIACACALAQIPQDQPRRCGRADEQPTLPAGTSFVPNPNAELTLRLLNGELKTIDLEPAEAVLQVCQLTDHRLVVFGAIGGGDGPAVWILSQIDGRKIDMFGARNAILSPDQHWVVFRRYYPRTAEIMTDDYLLYDLTKGPSQNEMPSEPPGAPNPPGRQIYPATVGHVPVNGALLEPAQVHTFAADSFYWSPDSRHVVFADRVEKSGTETTSVVVVEVGEKDLTTYVHPLNTSEMCAGAELGPRIAAGATLRGVEFAPARGKLPEIWARFSRDDSPASINPACAKPVRLYDANLKRAEIQVGRKPIGSRKKHE